MRLMQLQAKRKVEHYGQKNSKVRQGTTMQNKKTRRTTTMEGNDTNYNREKKGAWRTGVATTPIQKKMQQGVTNTVQIMTTKQARKHQTSTQVDSN